MATVASLTIPITVTGARSAQGQLQGVTQSAEKLGSTAEWLEGMVLKMAAAFSAVKVAQFIKESADLAANYEMLGAAMGAVGRNAGHSTDEMEKYEQQIQKLGISMKASRVVLTQMASANLDLSQAAKLARMAQDAGTIGMVNSSEAMMRMVNGIRSGETETLKALGIQVNNEQVYKRLARTLHTTVEGLSDHEKQQARLNAVLDKATAIQGAYEARMGTAGGTMMSMERITEDLQTSFGKLFLPAYSVIVADLKKELEGLAAELKRAEQNGDLAGTAILGMTLNVRDAASGVNDLVGAILGLDNSTQNISDWPSVWEVGLEGVALVVGVIVDAFNVLAGTLQAIWGGLNALVSGIITGVTKLIGMLVGFQPPKWMTAWLDWSAEQSEQGINRATKFMTGQGATAQAYTGENAQAEKDRQEAQRRAARTSEEQAAAAKKVLDKRLEDERKAAREAAVQEQSKLKMAQEIQSKIADVYASSDPAEKFYQSNVAWLKKLQAEPAFKALSSKDQKAAKGLPQLASDQKDRNIIAEQERAYQKLTMTFEQLAYTEAKEKGIRSEALRQLYASTAAEMANAAAMKTVRESLEEVGLSEIELINLRAKRQGLSTSTAGGQVEVMLRTKIEDLRKTTEDYGKTEEELIQIQLRRIVGTGVLTGKTLELSEAMKKELDNRRQVDFNKSLDPNLEAASKLEDDKKRIMAMNPNQKTDPAQSLTDQEMAMNRLNTAQTDLLMKQLLFRKQSGDAWAGTKLAVLDAVNGSTDAIADWITSIRDVGSAWEGLKNLIKSLVTQILESIMKMIIQMTIVTPIVEGLQNAMFGGGKAVGGDVVPGTSYLVGERGPEYFTPAVPGSITPNNQISGGGAQINAPVSVSVTINNEGNAQTDVKSQELAGKQLGDMIKSTVAAWYSDQSRPNGAVYNTTRALARG